MSVDKLINQAEINTGLNDWGDSTFYQGLFIFRQAVIDEANVGHEGLTLFDSMAIATLAKRLKIINDRKQFPEIAQQQIVAPLIVVGLPRTGSTILHALLSQDPLSRSPLDWEIDQPSPPPRAKTFKTDPRIAERRKVIDAMGPEMQSYHIWKPELPDECDAIMELSFQSFRPHANFYTPSYLAWLLATDTTAAYEFHRQTLQQLQAFTGNARWTLKSPPHIFWLDTLFKIYPDAQVVFTHRDPASVIPSTASLYKFIRSQTGSVTDPKTLGQEQLTLWRSGLERAIRWRKNNDREHQIVDVHYHDLINDPLTVVRRIYQYFNRPLSQSTEQKMAAFMTQNQQGKHGKHHYTLEEFGLDKTSVHQTFADYIENYDIQIN